MDFKCVTWAGNVYQKFETLCSEMEEIMYRDTVKYMENQVQKVSVSVKRFYSEVMEDLLPPSCVDPMKVTSCNLSHNPYAHADTNEKPIQSILDSHSNIKKKEKEDELIFDTTTDKESLPGGVNSLSPLSPGVLVQNKCSESCSAKSKKAGVYKCPVGIKRISENAHPSRGSSDMKSSLVVDSDDLHVVSSLDNDVRRDTGEAMKESTLRSDTPIDSPASGKSLSADPVRQKKDDSKCLRPPFDNNLLAESVTLTEENSECTSAYCGFSPESIGSSTNEITFAKLSSNIRSNACNDESNDKEVVESNEGTSEKDGSSNVSLNTCDAGSGVTEVIRSCEDYFDAEVIQNDEVAEVQRLQISEPVEGAKLTESCVLVEGDKLRFVVPLGTWKLKSYKKKIRKALSSKLRSTRNNSKVAIPVVAMDNEERKLSIDDCFESDWELL